MITISLDLARALIAASDGWMEGPPRKRRPWSREAPANAVRMTMADLLTHDELHRVRADVSRALNEREAASLGREPAPTDDPEPCGYGWEAAEHDFTCFRPEGHDGDHATTPLRRDYPTKASFSAALAAWRDNNVRHGREPGNVRARCELCGRERPTTKVREMALCESCRKDLCEVCGLRQATVTVMGDVDPKGDLNVCDKCDAEAPWENGPVL